MLGEGIHHLSKGPAAAAFSCAVQDLGLSTCVSMANNNATTAAFHLHILNLYLYMARRSREESRGACSSHSQEKEEEVVLACSTPRALHAFYITLQRKIVAAVNFMPPSLLKFTLRIHLKHGINIWKSIHFPGRFPHK